jgi:hypothetical protein
MAVRTSAVLFRNDYSLNKERLESQPDGFEMMTAEKPLKLTNGGWRQAYRERRFGILLVILMGLLVGSPVLFVTGKSGQWFEGLIAFVLLAAVQLLCLERHQRLFALLLGLPTILFSLGGDALSKTTGSASASLLFIGHLCGVLFLFGSAWLVVKSLFAAQTLTLDSIFGAVCGYLFLGLGWAMVFLMIETFRPGSFQVTGLLRSDCEPPQPFVLTYFSFVTLTTVGYGDVTPVSPTTRTLAWMEAMMGQFYLAIIVAGLVSKLVTKSGQDNLSTGTVPDRRP